MCGVCVASSVNEIGDEGAKGLAEGLSSNSTLQTLNLAGAYGGRGAGGGRREEWVWEGQGGLRRRAQPKPLPSLPRPCFSCCLPSLSLPLPCAWTRGYVSDMIGVLAALMCVGVSE